MLQFLLYSGVTVSGIGGLQRGNKHRERYRDGPKVEKRVPPCLAHSVNSSRRKWEAVAPAPSPPQDGEGGIHRQRDNPGRAQFHNQKVFPQKQEAIVGQSPPPPMRRGAAVRLPWGPRARDRLPKQEPSAGADLLLRKAVDLPEPVPQPGSEKEPPDTPNRLPAH